MQFGIYLDSNYDAKLLATVWNLFELAPLFI